MIYTLSIQYSPGTADVLERVKNDLAAALSGEQFSGVSIKTTEISIYDASYDVTRRTTTVSARFTAYDEFVAKGAKLDFVARLVIYMTDHNATVRLVASDQVSVGASWIDDDDDEHDVGFNTATDGDDLA